MRYRGDTVVLMKSGRPAAALVPYALLEQLTQEREALFAVIDEVQANNRDLTHSDAERMACDLKQCIKAAARAILHQL